MRWPSFIIGLLLFVIGLFTGVGGLIVLGGIGVVLLIHGSGESETEKLQKKLLKEQLEEIEKKKLKRGELPKGTTKKSAREEIIKGSEAMLRSPYVGNKHKTK